MFHVGDGVYVDERAHEGHEHHEGHRQRVDQGSKVDGQVAGRNPREQIDGQSSLTCWKSKHLHQDNDADNE